MLVAVPGLLKVHGLRAAPRSLSRTLQSREAGARPASSWPVITTHSLERQSETPEKLCKCKVTNPLRVARGQVKKEESVRREEPAAGEEQHLWLFLISRAIAALGLDP